MTKKKAPEELKRRGRKSKEHDNADLQDHLRGVTKLNQLTDEARKVMTDSVQEYFAKQKKRKTYTNKSMLMLITSTRYIKDESIKYNLEFFDCFTNDTYGDSSVRDYKMITIMISERLTAILQTGKPIRRDTPQGAEYFSGEEAYKLRNALDSGCTKDEFLKIIKNIYPELKHL